MNRSDTTVFAPGSRFPEHYFGFLVSLQMLTPRFRKRPDIIIDMYEYITQIMVLTYPPKRRLALLEKLYLMCVEDDDIQSFVTSQGIHRVDHWRNLVQSIGWMYQEMCRLYGVRPSREIGF